MNLTVRTPDELAARLDAGGDLERQALEGLRAGRINKDELGRVLGIDGLDQIDGFLKSRDVFEPYTVEDVNRDVEALIRLGF